MHRQKTSGNAYPYASLNHGYPANEYRVNYHVTYRGGQWESLCYAALYLERLPKVSSRTFNHREVVPICSSPRWDNLPSGHQRNPLLGIILWYMYWGQKDFSEKIEKYQYMQKKEVLALMGFIYLFFRFIGKKKVP